jgi:hypothetical protein
VCNTALQQHSRCRCNWCNVACYTVSGSPGMYDSMAERHRYREVLWQAAAAVLGTYALIMAGAYWFYAQFTVSPSK